MSGTLRDEHYVVEENGVRIRSEIQTIAEVLYPKRPLLLISMDSIIERTDAMEYIVKNLTTIRAVAVDDEKVRMLSNSISKEIDSVVDEILKRRRDMFLAEQIPAETKEKLHRAIAVLPSTDPFRIKFLRLTLVRRHIFASTPDIYSRFLRTPMFRRICQKYAGSPPDDLIPDDSSKVRRIVEMVKNWINLKGSIIIVTSFARTAFRIGRRLIDNGIENVYLLTGRTPNKARVIKDFKRKKPAVLVLTPVAERDLDFPEASLVIIHDVVSTVKSMYQRIKRARRSLVIILYYGGTFEERKVKILLSRMAKRYPWSIRIVW